MKALGARLAQKPGCEGTTVVALDPGLMYPTRLVRGASWLARVFFKSFGAEDYTFVAGAGCMVMLIRRLSRWGIWRGW